MPVDVSICAVTFRRPKGLRRLLESLARLKLPDLSAEIVVVDNDPNASAFGSELRVETAGHLPVRWQHEPAGDIARARNRAVDAAMGRWIAFIDDDEVAHEGWIASYDWLSSRAEADGFFGPVIPRLEVERESWLDLGTFYARPRRATGSVLGREGACTANAFVRRALLREVRFDPAFGRTLGEDTDCFLRATERGARFVWCDEACVDEFVPPERHRPGFLVRRALEGASAWARIEAPRCSRPLTLQLVSAVGRCGAALALLPFAALGGRRRAFAAWLRVCVQLGRLFGVVGGRVQRTGR